MDLKFNAPGAVVPPRETIANIVPNDHKLVIEAHIRTEDVSRVHQGQIAEVRFTAYKHRITPMAIRRARSASVRASFRHS